MTRSGDAFTRKVVSWFIVTPLPRIEVRYMSLIIDMTLCKEHKEKYLKKASRFIHRIIFTAC